MARKLTKKRRGFVKDYIETGNGTLAVKQNYDVEKDTTAGVIASQLLSDPAIQKTIAEALPDELLAEKHLALLNKMNGDDIDVKAVRSGLDMAYKIKGTYAPEKKVSVNANVDLAQPPKEAVQLAQEYEEKLKAKLLNESTVTNFDTRMDAGEQHQEREG